MVDRDMQWRVGRRRLAGAVAVATLIGGAVPAQAGPVRDVLRLVASLLDTTTGLLGGANWGYSPTATRLPEVAEAVRADRLLARGVSGKGVGVALIDTGVVPVRGLTSGNVVNGPDLSFDGQSPAPYLDGFGHGTHLAGIIAGNDGRANGFRGLAPRSTLLNVRVGAHDGAADVSQVIAAVDWVVAHRKDPGLNIRVLNLAYGTDGIQPADLDPLAHAVENAWRAGIVVVVAGGNSGTTWPSLDNPARDPYVLAVGASDINGTPGSPDDDVVPDFSSRGSSLRRVDVVAPGQSIVSLRDPGSLIDLDFPGAVVDGRLFKGSGTSQATAVVSGAVALLLQTRPELMSDDVKKLLMTTARPLPHADAAGQGAGLVDIAAAASAYRVSSAQTWKPSTGMGSLEAARGTDHVGDHGQDLVGERDIFGNRWDPATWAPASSNQTAWKGGTWNGADWGGTCWCGRSWASRTWESRTWSSRTWSGRTWSSTTWESRTWSGSSWDGGPWGSRTWSSVIWSGSSWSGAMRP